MESLQPPPPLPLLLLPPPLANPYSQGRPTAPAASSSGGGGGLRGSRAASRRRGPDGEGAEAAPEPEAGEQGGLQLAGGSGGAAHQEAQEAVRLLDRGAQPRHPRRAGAPVVDRPRLPRPGPGDRRFDRPLAHQELPRGRLQGICTSCPRKEEIKEWFLFC